MSIRYCLYLLILYLFIHQHLLVGQCNPYFNKALSSRPTHYQINVELNDSNKMIQSTQTIRYINQSSVEINDLRFYMYLNAFKHSNSSFLKGTSAIFGQSFANKPIDEWGWIDVQKIRSTNRGAVSDLSPTLKYISPDDNNPDDQTVLQVFLDKPLLPNDTIELQLDWSAKMPKTIARSGYSKEFYLFCHWFPQLGVFEKNNAGDWAWNCHQFFRSTEFYADFGVYDVNITTDKKFKMVGSGCLINESANDDHKVTRTYHAEDVIDFTWAINTGCKITVDRWQDVQINLVLPDDYLNQRDRFIYILKFALDYLHQHVGSYPYPSISVVCPPFHALQSGLMEYPTLITTGSFYGMPLGIRTVESLLVHEFVHQYFMGMVASNEKEEPWLDEGFATYFEDRIIDAAFGEKKSLIDYFGIRLDNQELSRLEYTRMKNHREGIVARPAWLFTESNRKSLIYSKTATTLHTLEHFIGEIKMDRFIKNYFEQWKFKHPRGHDLMAVLKSSLDQEVDSSLANQMYSFFQQSIYQAHVLDYAVTQISNEAILEPFGLLDQKLDQTNKQIQKNTIRSKVTIERLGDWIFPVEIQINFEDGTSKKINWSGIEGMNVLEFTGNTKVISAQIDPDQKNLLDININNNSLSIKNDPVTLWKFTIKFMFWIQNLFQTLSFLF